MRAAAFAAHRDALAGKLGEPRDRLGRAIEDVDRRIEDAAERVKLARVHLSGKAALHETDVELLLPIGQPLQVIERALRGHDVELHALAREDLLIALRG